MLPRYSYFYFHAEKKEKSTACNDLRYNEKNKTSHSCTRHLRLSCYFETNPSIQFITLIIFQRDLVTYINFISIFADN